jgi:hypothetical protein
MKVYQIISESRLTPYLNVLEKIGVAEIDKALGFLARLVGASKLTAKEIAESWATTAKKTKMPFEDVVMLGERELRAAGVDDALIKASLKEAEKYEAGIFARINKRLDKIGSKVDAGKAVTGKGFDVITTVAYKFGIYEPILECLYDIYSEYSDYSSQKIDYATFQNNCQFWINKAVGRVAATAISSWGIAKIATIIGGVPGPLGMKVLDGFYKRTTQVAQTGVNVWLQTPSGREALAQAFVADLLFNVPVNVNGRIEQQPIQQMLRDTLGGWITKFMGLARDQAEKIYDPAGSVQRTADKEKQAAADKAKDDAAYQGVSKGWETDQYGQSVKKY